MIHFVGAGCGAPDLITVRGMHLLEKTDVIIYAGSLVNPKLLDYAKADCQVYNSAVMTLEEVLAVMVEAEQEGKDVVRLHTGEPSIYGAVQEQMQELDAKKIAYDSTPGVSACFGAAAAMNLDGGRNIYLHGRNIGTDSGRTWNYQNGTGSRWRCH